MSVCVSLLEHKIKNMADPQLKSPTNTTLLNKKNYLLKTINSVTCKIKLGQNVKYIHVKDYMPP